MTNRCVDRCHGSESLQTSVDCLLLYHKTSGSPLSVTHPWEYLVGTYGYHAMAFPSAAVDYESQR